VPNSLGGVHPSLLPEQTVASQYVDIVVRGESDRFMAELAENWRMVDR